MNSLEFINQQIEEIKKAIKQSKLRIEEFKKYPSLVKGHKERIEELKPILKHLEQIKSVLEVWKVCKQNAHINKYEDINKNRSKQRFDICIWLNTENCNLKGCAKYKDILKVRKALEVKDEKED